MNVMEELPETVGSVSSRVVADTSGIRRRIVILIITFVSYGDDEEIRQRRRYLQRMKDGEPASPRVAG